MASSRTTPRLLTGAFTALLASAALALAGCSQAAPEPSGGESGGSASVAPPAIIKEGQLTICTGDSPPNIYYDENNELIGVEIDLANALAENLGLQTSLAEYAFAGLIPALQAKQCDVIMGSLYIKPEREEIANFVPYLYSGTGVGVAKENPRNVTGNDDSLCGLKVVAITGATGAAAADTRSEACEAAGKAPLNITLIDEGATAVQQVLTGQQDAFIDTSEIMGFYGQQSDGAITLVGEVSDKIRIGAATLKDNTELNEALAEAFQTMIDDGTYHAILEEWDVTGNDITQAD
ncbi:ABC transporter substrate-binding protein [Leucobacter celer]|uniref:ABC transporter substrate-binding protein n=1 Tax=Leucobacter celer TaxID=668625 RepID=UPI0006A75E57|nr:ABC transporter substrate-binding protein [Leucobacter celer]